MHLVDAGIEHIFTINIANARAANGPAKRHPGNRQCRRDGDQSDNIRIVFQIVAEHGGDHLCFVFKSFDEKRTDWPVDEARHQRFFFAGAPFALKIAAGHFTRSVSLFLIIDSQGEKIQPGLWAAVGNHCCQYGCFNIGRQYRTISLTGNAASFQDKWATAPFDFFACNFKHIVSYSAAPNPMFAPRHLPGSIEEPDFLHAGAGPFFSLTGNTNPMPVRPGFALIEQAEHLPGPDYVSDAIPAVQSMFCNGLHRAI